MTPSPPRITIARQRTRVSARTVRRSRTLHTFTSGRDHILREHIRSLLSPTSTISSHLPRGRKLDCVLPPTTHDSGKYLKLQLRAAIPAAYLVRKPRLSVATLRTRVTTYQCPRTLGLPRRALQTNTLVDLVVFATQQCLSLDLRAAEACLSLAPLPCLSAKEHPAANVRSRHRNQRYLQWTAIPAVEVGLLSNLGNTFATKHALCIGSVLFHEPDRNGQFELIPAGRLPTQGS